MKEVRCCACVQTEVGQLRGTDGRSQGCSGQCLGHGLNDRAGKASESLRTSRPILKFVREDRGQERGNGVLVR